MFPVDPLRKWFLSCKRSLPWRDHPTAYKVWVSEVMLQQTQASVVIPYYLKWLEKFPTIEKLAASSLEDVIKVWEGLGYYSRARALHESAKEIVNHLGGIFPKDPARISQLKGIGEYTLGAILSFAYHQKIPAIDGNVKRVLSRFFLIKDPIDSSITLKNLYKMVNDFLPEKEPWVINEALIELGALVCKKKPDCLACPLKFGCKAFQNSLQHELPIKKRPQPKATLIHRHVFIVKGKDAFLVKKGRGEKLLKDLYEFPSVDENELDMTPQALEELLFDNFNIEGQFIQHLPKEEHGYTRYQIKLYPYFFVANSHSHLTSEMWVHKEKLGSLPFSSGHRRILNQLSPFMEAYE